MPNLNAAKHVTSDTASIEFKYFGLYMIMFTYFLAMEPMLFLYLFGPSAQLYVTLLPPRQLIKDLRTTRQKRFGPDSGDGIMKK